MLGTLSPWLSLRRARGAGSVFVAAAAVWAAVACSSDDDSSASNEGGGGDQGSGGDGGSSGGSDSNGGSDSAGGSGGAPNDGGGGDTSSGGSGGSGGSSTPGDFSSVWQADSVELLLYDATGGIESQTVEMPAKVESPVDGREVEFYVTFEGEQRITYAYTEGDPAYYRLLETAISVSGDFYAVQSEEGSHSYSLEDGKLTEITQQSFGSAWTAFTTTTYKKVEDFPPSDWPSEVVDHEVEGAE